MGLKCCLDPVMNSRLKKKKTSIFCTHSLLCHHPNHFFLSFFFFQVRISPVGPLSIHSKHLPLSSSYSQGQVLDNYGYPLYPGTYEPIQISNSTGSPVKPAISSSLANLSSFLQLQLVVTLPRYSLLCVALSRSLLWYGTVNNKEFFLSKYQCVMSCHQNNLHEWHQQDGRKRSSRPWFLPWPHQFNNNTWINSLCEKSRN